MSARTGWQGPGLLHAFRGQIRPCLILWDHARAIVLDPSRQGGAVDLNNHGQVIGYDFSPTAEPVPVVYTVTP